MSKDIAKKIEKLREEIRHHDYMYYGLSHPEISDKEYDDLMRELKRLEEEHPEFKSDVSPTVRISGGILEGFKTTRHRQKMLSLDNTYSFEELKEWDERVHKGLGSQKVEYVVELKIDGVSANITYKEGSLSIGATRGDGERGENVTENIKKIRPIPLLLRGKSIPSLIEIRGEVYMKRGDFQLLNKERQIVQEALFANPRNAASGSLKLLDTGVVARRRLNFFAHSLGECKGIEILSQAAFLENLKEWRVCVNPQTKLCRSLTEVIAYCQAWQEKRGRLDYDIDGVVIKINSFAQQKRLSYTLKSPRWAVAYKFPAHQVTSVLKSISVQVGRTGVITPVAELQPVECSGVTISHATLHNFDEIKRLRIKVGDRVVVERAGEVIPKIVKAISSRRTGREREFKIPKNCPACGREITKEKAEEVAYRCINPSCPAQVERGLIHFASRVAMDIEGMGDAVVRQLVGKGLVKDFADIYSLDKGTLLKLDLFKDKKAENLLVAIEKSKQRPLSRLIYGLGIRHVGEKASYILAQKFRAMDNLMRAHLEDLCGIYEIGQAMAESIVNFFKQDNTKKLLKELKEAGLNFQETSIAVKKSALTVKTVVFTGELKDFSRTQAEDMVRRLGGNAASSVSENTDLVVAGDNPGSKYDKAKKLGVKIIDESEFKEMIK